MILEFLSRGLGFVSASLVALIALAFGAMFLFFSGSAALILGHFLRFVRPARVALPAIGLAAVIAAGAALATSAPVWWSPPLAELVCGLAVWGLVRARRLHRALRLGTGALFLVCGAIFVAGLVLPGWSDASLNAVRVVALVLLLAAVGVWPLVLAGLVEHRLSRPVEWFIGLRYLVARRRQTFISVISVICVLGVALGVAVITVVLSVMNGFSAMWEEKVIGARAHFSVMSRAGDIENYREMAERVRGMPNVVGATPYLATDAILRGHDGGLQAIVLKGVDVASVGSATQLVETIRAGSLADLEPDPNATGELAKLPGVIVGAEIANRFLLRVGDPLVLISPMGGQPTPLGPAPRLERFRIAGIFRSDFFQFDESFVYASLSGAQKFMKLGDVAQGIEVRTVDPYRSKLIANEVEAGLDSRGLYYTRDWKEYFPGFFQALKTERVMMFVLLSFIMVVAGFIIVATLIMMIMEKSQDIAILKTMGCADDGILRVFAIEGFLIGVVGLAVGIGMGLVITWNLDVIQSVVERTFGFDVLPANVYQLQRLPHAVEPAQLALISMIAMVLSIGATLLPSWQASHLDPAEALRYE
ncbi:MAG TPA: lipoprotein-releasing ABC transporter permease subunit [Myxococcota bacterium]|nr:lipoprotein-releasing ABC transporter permease subunit [Myxococcota bacterium]